MPKKGREVLLVDSEKEAEEIMEYMKKRCRECGLVTVSEFKLKAGKSSSRMDQEYGWYDANDIYYKRTAFGYEINMPKAVLLT